MVATGSNLVTLVELVDRLPLAATTPTARGRPQVYSDRLVLKALVIMIVKRLPTVPLLLSTNQPWRCNNSRRYCESRTATRRAARLNVVLRRSRRRCLSR